MNKSLKFCESNFKYGIDDIYCEKYPNLTNSDVFHKCVYINVNVCQLYSIMICMTLISLAVAKWKMPHSTRIKVKTHTNLIYGYLAATADVVDLVDYSNDDAITAAIGVVPIYSKYILI